MPVKAQCPYCSVVFRVPREKIGLKAKCSKCGASFRLKAMPDATPEGNGPAPLDMPEPRGPFGLPRWTMPAVWLTIFVAVVITLTYNAFVGDVVEQLGPSEEVLKKLERARRMVDSGEFVLAQPFYQDAIALAGQLGRTNADVVEVIKEELAAVKEDAELSVVLAGVEAAPKLADLPLGPNLPKGQRLALINTMYRKPQIGAGKTFLLITCWIDNEKIGRDAIHNDEKVTQFAASEFSAIDKTTSLTYKAVGFRMDQRYIHGGLIIRPRARQAEVQIAVVFAVPDGFELQRIRYKDELSTRIFTRKY